MTTYNERYGGLWRMFINKKFFEKSASGKRALTRGQLISLANEFESFLMKISENLGIAG